MRFLLAGVSHRTAPVEVRERLAFSPDALPAALAGLCSLPGVAEGMILSTCNRVEIAAALADENAPAPPLGPFLCENRSMPQEGVTPHLYTYEDDRAIHHLFRVASSLDSMVVGEPQILGQLKTAYAVAKAHGAAGAYLDAVLTRAFGAAKRVRSETGVGESAVSVSYAAVELAREIFATLEGKNVMIVGAGKMSELAARHLHRSGASNIFVTNRTPARAREVAHLFHGRIVEYDKFLESLPGMDIVIASSGAPFYILRADQMRRVIEARRNQPMFLIDIAVPRNIEPAVNGIDNVFLYDIDDLQKVVDANVGERKKRAELAEKIVDEEVERTISRLRVREVVPTIVNLQDQLEQWRAAEVARVRGKLGELTPQQEEALEALTRGLIAKIAHGPISELRKSAGQPEGLTLIDAIRKAFRLEN
jgi:glutamyl-tRNA reductase